MGLPPLAHETLTRAPRLAAEAGRTWARTGALLPVLGAAGAGVLLLAYERLSATAPITADSANAVLQGRSMATGNVVLSALLAVSVFSDALALYVGVLPIVIVALLPRLRGRGQRLDRALLATALISVVASVLLMGVIDGLGGFATVPLQASFARVEDLPRNTALALEGILLLFGANFFGQPIASLGTLVMLVHLAGVAFVALCCRWVVQASRQGSPPDRVTQVLLVGMAADLAAYLLSNQAIDLRTSRYLIPFLAFGAVLAGRVGADRLRGTRLRGGAVGVGLAYLLFAAVG